MSQVAGVAIPSREAVLTAFVDLLKADAEAASIANAGIYARQWPSSQEQLPEPTTQVPTWLRARAVLPVDGGEASVWHNSDPVKTVIQLLTETNQANDSDVPGLRLELFHSRATIVVLGDGLTPIHASQICAFERLGPPTVTQYDDDEKVYWMSSLWGTIISNA